mgnify:FL=1
MLRAKAKTKRTRSRMMGRKSMTVTEVMGLTCSTSLEKTKSWTRHSWASLKLSRLKTVMMRSTFDLIKKSKKKITIINVIK